MAWVQGHADKNPLLSLDLVTKQESLEAVFSRNHFLCANKTWLLKANGLKIEFMAQVLLERFALKRNHNTCSVLPKVKFGI